MLQSEFQNLVGMKVTTKEYWCINEVYNNSDLDKDAFCKLWVKMNKSRVQKAKEDAKKAKEEEKVREQLWNIIEKYGSKDWQWKYEQTAYFTLSGKMMRAAIKSGLYKTNKNMADLLYDIRKYLSTPNPFVTIS